MSVKILLVYIDRRLIYGHAIFWKDKIKENRLGTVELRGTFEEKKVSCLLGELTEENYELVFRRWLLGEDELSINGLSLEAISWESEKGVFIPANGSLPQKNWFNPFKDYSTNANIYINTEFDLDSLLLIGDKEFQLFEDLNSRFEINLLENPNVISTFTEFNPIYIRCEWRASKGEEETGLFFRFRNEEEIKGATVFIQPYSSLNNPCDPIILDLLESKDWLFFSYSPVPDRANITIFSDHILYYDEGVLLKFIEISTGMITGGIHQETRHGPITHTRKTISKSIVGKIPKWKSRNSIIRILKEKWSERTEGQLSSLFNILGNAVQDPGISRIEALKWFQRIVEKFIPKTIIIIDPYLNYDGIYEILPTLASITGVEVILIGCKLTDYPLSVPGEIELVKKAINYFLSKGLFSSCKLYLYDHKFHDRYLLFYKEKRIECWMLGSSLSSIGFRFSGVVYINSEMMKAELKYLTDLLIHESEEVSI